MGRPRKGEEKPGVTAVYNVKFPVDLAIRLEDCLHSLKIRAIPNGRRGQSTADFFRQAVTNLLDEHDKLAS